MKANLILVIFLLVVLSCNNTKQTDGKVTSNNNISQNTMEKVIESKELHVGYFIFEPTILKNPQTDSLEGVFIDMIEKIAKSISPNVKVIYHPTTLATFHTELNSNQFDICIGATFATPKRASIVAFTHPLFYCGYTGVTLKNNKEKFKSWASIDSPSVKIAVLQGSAIADLIKSEFKSQNNIKSFPGADATIPLAAVGSNQADVGLMNQITVFTYLREHPELVEIMGDKPLATTYFSWSVRHNDIQWLNYINICIDYLINTGEMYSYEKKYSVPLMHPKVDFYFPNN